MSHIDTVQTRVQDPVAVTSACRRLGMPEPVRGTATATGLLVTLPDRLYPLVLDTATGQVHLDNYQGA